MTWVIHFFSLLRTVLFSKYSGFSPPKSTVPCFFNSFQLFLHAAASDDWKTFVLLLPLLVACSMFLFECAILRCGFKTSWNFPLDCF